MKKMLKSTLGIAAAVALTGAAVAPVVLAWSDSAGGRATYRIQDINAGKIDDKIVFNSIIASSADLTEANKEAGDIIPLSDERNFVGARVDDGNHGKNNVWNGNEITVEEGKTYIVRMYIHNNNRLGTKMTAKDVTAQFNLQNATDNTFKVEGIFTSSNATPNEYRDSVVFKSSTSSRFYLDYIEGSALLENNGYAKGGKTISDDLLKNGVKIGYAKEGDGKIPGCYQYAEYVSFKVKPVFESSSIKKTVSLAGTEQWVEDLHAKVGDEIEYRIEYKNLNNSQVNNVVLIDSLPKNVEYIKGTTMLYNGLNPKGIKNTDDTITTTGINIGYYPVNAPAVVRFKAKIVDENLACNKNTQLVNLAKAGSTTVGYAIQDSANVFVEKTCKEPEPEDPCKVNPNDPQCKPKDPCEVNPNDPQCKPKDPCEVNPDAPECKKDPCEENPNAPECKKDPCEENPNAPECKPKDPCEVNPNDPQCKPKDPCEENPNAPECKEPEPEPEDYCKVHPDDAKCKKQPEIITVVTEMPSTGPVAAAGTALGAGTVVTAAGYLISSRKQLRK